MLLLLIQAMKSLFPSMQTFTFFLLTEFEFYLLEIMNKLRLMQIQR